MDAAFRADHIGSFLGLLDCSKPGAAGIRSCCGKSKTKRSCRFWRNKRSLDLQLPRMASSAGEIS
jgi:hypothetical protein